MTRRLLIALAIVLLGAAEAGATADDPAAADAEAAARLVEQILRLQSAIEVLASPVADADGEAVGAPEIGGSDDELTLRLLALRQEIDQILILLEAQSAEVRAEVQGLLAGRPGGSDSPPPPSVDPTPPQADEPVPQRAEVEVPEELEVPVPVPVSGPVSAPEATCAEFAAFDSNGDGLLSGLDRYWRYFRLWRDDGDGVIEEKEIRGLYDSGVQELTVVLRTFRTVDGVAGDVLGSGTIRLAGLDRAGGRGGPAVLTLDADRLARGDELELRDGTGKALTGRQALDSDMVIAATDGVLSPLECP